MSLVQKLLQSVDTRNIGAILEQLFDQIEWRCKDRQVNLALCLLCCVLAVLGISVFYVLNFVVIHLEFEFSISHLTKCIF